MKNTLVINQLAARLSEENLTKAEREQLFADLYNRIYPTFENIVRSYMVNKNLTGFSFDLNDYYSILGQTIMESLTRYEKTKGDFLARVRAFAYNRFRNVTEKNLAEKRFDKTKATYSMEELFESTEFDIVDSQNFTYEESETFRAVADFIKGDKDGKVIEILYLYAEGIQRRQALENYFGGKYEAAERKKVQRIRERLEKHLANIGVFI